MQGAVYDAVVFPGCLTNRIFPVDVLVLMTW